MESPDRSRFPEEVKNYLILGGTGKTGRRIASRLAAAGHEVRTASRTGGDVRSTSTTPPPTPRPSPASTAAYLLEPGVRRGRQQPAAPGRRGRRRGGRRSPPPGPALRSRRRPRPAPPARHRAGGPRVRPRMDRRAPGMVRAELQRGLLAPRRPQRDPGPARRRGPRSRSSTPRTSPTSPSPALTEDRHAGEVYELTGPRALGFGEAAELIAAASGKPLRYVAVTPEVFLEQQIAGGVPRPAAERMARLIGLGSTGALEG